MMLSAGVLMYRMAADSAQVLIGHMGGPFWARKDDAAWSIPKGEVAAGEDPLATALREFEEELGHAAPTVGMVDLGTFEQSRNKQIRVWAVQGDLDPDTCVSNMFEMEWPPKSGRMQSFPEIDRAAWFSIDDARDKLIRGQQQVLDRLFSHT